MQSRNRPYNFGAGPAMLPEAILKQVQSELMDWNGLGVSILEISHRSSEFQQLMQETERRLRLLLNIPKQYHVLFLNGAARTQFSMIPMNLVAKEETAAYVISGVWSQLAYLEASKLAKAQILVSSEQEQFYKVPTLSDLPSDEQRWAYVYFTPNETINGVRFAQRPEFGDVPLIADMTSCLLTEPINVSDYGLIFAGAQKNIAAPGLTLVIVRDDLLEKTSHLVRPSMLDYKIHVQHQSMYGTPPVFNCYLAHKMFQWMLDVGGISALYKQNLEKSNVLYDYIDSSHFYVCPVEKSSRSLVNVVFFLPDPSLEKTFISMARERGLYALTGHKLIGGLRASLYNAMPIEGVEALITFMQEFKNAFYQSSC